MRQHFTIIPATTKQAMRWYAQQHLTLHLLLLLFLGLAQLANAQEGTKQLMPNATDRLYIRIDPFAKYGANTQQRMNIYLNVGEKMHFGMQLSDGTGVKFRIKDAGDNIVFPETSVPTSAGTGYIDTYTEAVSGPNGVKLNGSTVTSGYTTPFVYTAASSGNHYIEFTGDNNAELSFLDVTVTDAANNIITNPDDPNRSAGRLWSQQWSLSTTSFTNFPVNAEFYVFTADEFVNKVKYEMKPNVFDFVANSFGTALTGEQIVRQQSQEGNVLGSTSIGEYKIFLNDPDQAAFPTNNIPPPVVKAWLDNTQLYDYDYNRSPQQLDLSANKPTITRNAGTCPDPSSATFTVESNVSGKATILIDANGDGFVVGTNDRALYMDITPGVNKLVWDLKDANGTLLTDGNFTASGTFLARGPAHFPLYDVESLSGITTSSIRPYSKLNPTLYWDDSNISDWADKSGTNAMAVTKQSQLVINANTPRVWTYSSNNNENNNGNKNTMNSWFNAIDLGLAGFDFTIVTSTSQCNNGSLPVVSDIQKSGVKNADIAFANTDFTNKYSDPGNVTLNKIKILSLPSGTEGVLKLNGVAITLNQEINFADLNNITFTPINNFTGNVSVAWNGSNGSDFATQPASINIAINTAPNISNIGNQAVCADNATSIINFTVGDAETAAGSLTVSASSSNLTIVPIANIVLGGAGANRTITVTPASGQSGSSTITVFVSDGNSNSSASFIVTAGPSSNFTGSTSACVGNALNLTAEETGATSYSWKKEGVEVASTQTFSIASMAAANEGTYTLTVVKNGCTSSKSFQVSIFPHISFTGTTDVCLGGTLTLVADETVATSYSWKKGGVEVGNSQTLTINNIQAANIGADYTLTIEKEGCTNTSPAFAVSLNGPTVAIANGAKVSFCGTSGVLTATAVTGATYQWKKEGANIGTNSNQLTVTEAGSYTVTVLVGGCTNTSEASIVTFNQINSSVTIASNANNNAVCAGQSIAFTATATNGGTNPTYQWQVNGNNVAGATQSFFTSNALSHNDAVTVVMQANISCPQTVNSNEILVTVNALPTITFATNSATISNNEVTITEGESITIDLTGAATYTWTPATGINSQSADGAQVVLAPTSTTTYVVTATSATGCQGAAPSSLKVIVNPKTDLFIPSLFSPNGDGQNDRFIVRGTGIQRITFRVFDRSGHLIYETNSVDEATTTGWDGTKDGVNQPIGMYTWSITGAFVDGREISFKGAKAGKINLLR
ncbi:T9SS C-terminal target domain-containing protein [Microscilla marina]|uniref:Ig-like domain-containing protein n=1 Tax=Microscilla marina ATCC 23134 TaxID=313606 RepID=A1ZJS8_MICM2|nr:T9SS C-terminal target domain-containing protein [Microscilla marina]EAY29381.1 hypothetical protein M23134_01437 [Microscilla marina ATCC 23134]